ncbi:MULTISPECIES: YceH family protein [Sphingobacterium]|uniref:UPF0502 protein n=1 Tax=Sphingobacterium cellulitidis TaxID=1768011 RepID=A0A8H9G4A5_9SPHI|nr:MULTISPECIES: YceH family protein [Sphingobacterium]MBA8988355.1 hypothetical protein [Sphingobacterium soli]OYD42449.1 DUF480 domain-containing protein [Sphingobacterium cellulitidis]WFB65285.1 YceH family protein [Sphingobacterium sp. WM]GGE31906.1 UPF0502 protein [Sphingobacterium soli]
MEENLSIPILSQEEIRVLGSMLEKSKTTPEYYPLTLNGLLTACNQKTSRKPVVQYDESTVIQVLDTLRKKGLISTVVGGGSRVTKYKHNLAIQFPLLPQELAIICLLFLRGPMTAGELNTNSGRLYEFENLDQVFEILDKLSSEEPNYIKQLPKRPGQKEARYIHLFAEFDEDSYEDENSSPSAPANNSAITVLEERVSQLEEQLQTLRNEFDELMKQLS